MNEPQLQEKISIAIKIQKEVEKLAFGKEVEVSTRLRALALLQKILKDSKKEMPILIELFQK